MGKSGPFKKIGKDYNWLNFDKADIFSSDFIFAPRLSFRFHQERHKQNKKQNREAEREELFTSEPVVTSEPEAVFKTATTDNNDFSSTQTTSFSGFSTFSLTGTDGTPGDDVLVGDETDETFFGYAGDDSIDGQGGNDTMHGGTGNDTYHVGDGIDTVIEEGGTNDTLMINALFTDIVSVDTSTDDFIIVLDSGVDEIIIQGQNGPDPDQKIETLVFSDGFEISFGDFQNWVTVTTLQPNYNGTTDNDVVVGSDGANFISGNDGNDIIYGADGNDILFGDAGDDIIFGGVGDETSIHGGTGEDTLYGGDGNDFLFGAEGNDTLFGDAGNDTLIGAGGADILHGGDGDDTLQGTSEDDTLYGDAGDDELFAGAGNDHMEGGTGNDTYFFNPGEGSNTVVEAGGIDVIEVNASLAFADLSFTRLGDDLVISSADSNMTIIGQFSGDTDQQVETLNVSDNPNFDLTTLILPDSNTPPDAQDDVFDVANADAFAGNILGNDSDADGDAFSVLAQTIITANGGTVTLSENGDFSYSAADEFSGSDSFTYTITDSHGTSNTATVTLNNVVGVHAPVAADDAFTGAEDNVVTGNVLADNGNGADSDANGDPLTVTAGTFTSLSGATIVLAANGDFTYTPVADFHGTDSFTYTVNDGQGGSDTATVTLDITAVNDAPNATDDSFDAGDTAFVAGNVLGNDTDIDGDTLSTIAQNITTANGGTVTLDTNGNFTYDAADGYTGSDSFTYSIDDGQGGSDTASVSINNIFGAFAPVAADDAFTGAEDNVVTGNVLADNGNGADSDANGDPLTVTAGTFTSLSGATIVLAANGDFTYTPVADFNGTDSFTYTVNDGQGGSDSATVTLDITAVNDAPNAADDSFDAGDTAFVAGNVLGNDTDIDGDTLSTVAQNITTANGGTVTLDTNGNFTYDAADGYTGSDSFTYSIDDGQGGSDTASVSINNIFGAFAPIAADDAFTGAEDNVVTGNVLADNGNGADSDVNGDPLTVTAGTFTSLSGATIVLAANGDFTYTPVADFHGTDSFTYTVNDGQGGSDTATVTLDVTAVNDAPNAIDDSFDAGDTAFVAGNVLGNDTDIDGDTLSTVAQNITTANGGTVTLDTNGNFTYDAAQGYTGSDSFTYSIDDGQGGSDSATVTLNNISFPVADIAPEVTPETSSVFAELLEVDIPFDLDPTPQDFPDLVERTRLNPPSVINGTNRENLTFDNDHDVEIRFVTEGAGYKNTIGVYTISETGAIDNVQILAENLSGTGSGVFGGGSFNTGDLIADLGVLEAGTEIGFFIIADGANKNSGTYNNYDIANGGLEFRNSDTGNASTVFDDASDTDLYFTDAQTGDVVALQGNIWHSSFEALNTDGAVHAVSGTNEDGNLTIGFEDLENLGDADFNDVVIEMVVAPSSTVTLNDVAVAENFDVIDADDDSLTSIEIDLSNGAQAGDYLNIDAGLLAGTNIVLTQNSPTSITLSGEDTPANYEIVVQSLTFGSNAETPATGVRDIEITATDADGLTDTSQIDVTVGAPGSAPLSISEGLEEMGLAFAEASDLFADMEEDGMNCDAVHDAFEQLSDAADVLNIHDILESEDSVAAAIEDIVEFVGETIEDIGEIGDGWNAGGFDNILAQGFLDLADNLLQDDVLSPQPSPDDFI